MNETNESPANSAAYRNNPASAPAPAPAIVPQPSLAASILQRLTYTPIPSEIHIVHLGPMNNDVQGNVDKWAKSNPGWKKNLWVSKNYLTTDQWEGMQAHAKDIDYRLHNIDDEICSDPHPPIPAVSSAREQAAKRNSLALSRGDEKFVNVNYGVESDFVRIEILMKKGGVYVDTDMAPGENLPTRLMAKHGFLCNVKGKGGQDTAPCNDILGAAPKNKVLRAYGDEAARRYLMSVKAEEVAPKLIKDDMTPEVQAIRAGVLKEYGMTEIDAAIPESDLFQKNNENKRKTATIHISGPITLQATLKAVDPKIPKAGILGLNDLDKRGWRFPPQYVADYKISKASWLGRRPDQSHEIAGTLAIHSKGTGTSGVSWIEFTNQSGSSTTFTTRRPQDGTAIASVKSKGALFQDLATGKGDISRKSQLTEGEFQILLKTLSEYTTETEHPSASFAADVWHATKGEQLPHQDDAGHSDPARLTQSIATLNQRDQAAHWPSRSKSLATPRESIATPREPIARRGGFIEL